MSNVVADREDAPRFKYASSADKQMLPTEQHLHGPAVDSIRQRRVALLPDGSRALVAGLVVGPACIHRKRWQLACARCAREQRDRSREAKSLGALLMVRMAVDTDKRGWLAVSTATRIIKTCVECAITRVRIREGTEEKISNTERTAPSRLTVATPTRRH
jgi:hypothetical protein